ncbi:MAG: penicillin-binding protein 2 [bacterium]|nr:penicillin-binding protein 2 [bacterium]
MKHILRIEHWCIQKFKFDRMSNNLFWLAIVLLPLIISMALWILRLHERTDRQFFVSNDSYFSGMTAEVFYQDNAFYFRPLADNLLLNFSPVTKTTQIHENDRLVIGHSIFQVRQLDGWTPNLRTIGYYATDRDLQHGVSIGRSIHPEELNQWETNGIIVKDNRFEPVHFRIFSEQDERYRVKNLGMKGVYVPYAPPEGEKLHKDSPKWTHVMEGTALKAGQRLKVEGSIFELNPVPSQEALALKIIRGRRPTFTLSRQASNIIGGVRMIPKHYIPDYLVDEEFLEYVRQAIEHGLFFLDDPEQRQGEPEIYVKGFDREGKLVVAEFQKLSAKENFLLHKIFRFYERDGVELRWRRPFNREAKNSYKFYPNQIENFIMDLEANQVKNIYQYAARLTNPHIIAEEVATVRGEIYDRDRRSHARLVAYIDPEASPVAELLLVPSPNPAARQKFNIRKEPVSTIFAASAYTFNDGAQVLYEAGKATLQIGGDIHELQDGREFTSGRYTFRYQAPGKGLLAQNLTDERGTTRRHYPLGSLLAHIVGYSFSKSQFKGNLEKVFDKVLLGWERKRPWWSIGRTKERTPGNNLILTIDDDLQKIIHAELLKKLNELNTRYKTDAFKGAALVLNREGEIMASTSIPSYDPNQLRSIFQAMNESNEDHWNSRYINRATHKSFPPGSTMKVIMSTIALDNKEQFLWPLGDGQYLIKNGQGSFACTGRLNSFRGASFGKYGIPDFGGSSHGQLTLDTALTKSCNNTFAFLALSAGWPSIQHYAERYGFNQQFDFLPYEMFKDDPALVSSINRDFRDPLASLKSQVPTPKGDLKLSQLGRMGIGQWEILATPLQMATVAMTVGNLGLRPYPHIVAGIESAVEESARMLPYPAKVRSFTSNVMAELFPMMQHVVQRGSAARITRSTIKYYSLKEHVAGKTGTAEVEDRNRRKLNVVWFISFAPVENPQMTVAVVIERGKIISGEAVDVARGIWEKAVLLYPEWFPATTEQGNL